MMDVDGVLDELSIRRLVDTFCHAVNSRDVLLWGSVWIDDGATFCLGGTDIVGKDAILAGFRSGITAYELLFQAATNGLIEIDRDTATARWSLLEIGQLREGVGKQLVGVCHDEYRRTPDGWRLQRREVEAIYKDEAELSGWMRPVID